MRQLFESLGCPTPEQLESIQRSYHVSKIEKELEAKKAGMSSSAAVASSAALPPSGSSALSESVAFMLTNSTKKMAETKLEWPEGEEADAMCADDDVEDAPLSTLSPEAQVAQRRRAMVRHSVQQLRDVPMESLSPELQQLRRQLDEALDRMPPSYHYNGTQRSINKLLRDNGEDEVVWHDYWSPEESIRTKAGMKLWGQVIKLRPRVRVHSELVALLQREVDRE